MKYTALKLLLEVRADIDTLSEEQQDAISDIACSIRGILRAGGAHAELALMLVSAEVTSQYDE